MEVATSLSIVYTIDVFTALLVFHSTDCIKAYGTVSRVNRVPAARTKPIPTVFRLPQ